MNTLAPTLVGFRLLFRRPLIFLAEVAWRWTFAAAAWALGTAFVFEYLGSLPVTTADRLLLSTGQPFFIARAFRRIFTGSSIRLVEAAIVLGIGLGVAWIVLASLGRVAVLRSIFDELAFPTRASHAFRSLTFLNFLRATVVVAVKIAAIGSILFASSLWASSHVRLEDAIRFEFLVWLLFWLAWAVLNWLLSTAAIYVVAEGKDSLSAMGGVLQLLQSRTVGMLGASAIFGIIHFVCFAVTFGISIVLLPVAVARPIALPLVFVLIFAYCFVADFLYTGRLIAYAYLATGLEDLPSWMRATQTSPLRPVGMDSSVDKDELILGDLPAPA
jgi:hypothetical protein